MKKWDAAIINMMVGKQARESSGRCSSAAASQLLVASLSVMSGAYEIFCQPWRLQDVFMRKSCDDMRR